MREIEIKKMPIAQIIQQVGVALQPQDVVEVIDISREDVIEEFDRGFKEVKPDEYPGYLINFLREHEEVIDKVSMIMLSLANYIKMLPDDEPKAIEEGQESTVRRWKNRAREILKDVNKKIYMLQDEEGQKKVQVRVIGSQELITGEGQKKNSKKIAEMEEERTTLEDILASLCLSDLEEIICDRELGELIRFQSFSNAALLKGLINKESRFRIVDTQEEINELAEQVSFEEVLPEIAEVIMQNIAYIDLGKLLLCSAYRYLEYLEETPEGALHELVRGEIKRRLETIQKNLRGNSVKLEGRIEKKIFDDSEIKEQSEDEFEYFDISYTVGDLRRDMQKFEGNTYWGKSKIEEVRASLFIGESLLRDVDTRRLGLRREELSYLARENDDNYLYCLKNNLLDGQVIGIINEHKSNLSETCLNALKEQGYLEEADILELYLQGKVDVEYLEKSGIKMDTYDIHLEFIQARENNENDERKERIVELYKKTMIEGKTEEEIKQNKEAIFDAYFENFDAGYLETFFTLGALEVKDLEGLMSGENWIEALEKGEISESFFATLKQHNLILGEEIKSNEQILIKQLTDWEEGECSSEQIRDLQIPLEDLLRLCDEGKIKGTRIGEIIDDHGEKINYRRQIMSAYSCGAYETILPAVALYNSSLINRDTMINICKGMKAKSEEIFEICQKGLLKGTKIAELRYQGILSKKHFRYLKENEFVSEEQEIEVINNLTPEEMLQELEANGCQKIESIDEILAEVEKRRSKGNGQKPMPESPTIRSATNIRNPVKIYEILETLGIDSIVTTNESGFRGYQAFLIPKLGIAVLEKLFRKNRKGELRPSYEEATYICEIGKYIQVSGQTKQDIRNFMNVEGTSNGKVKVISHFDTWGRNLLKAITEVNPDIKMRKEKGVITSISRKDTELDIDVKKLNELVTYMAQGKYTLSLEEYE